MLKDRKLVIILGVTVLIILVIGIFRPREIDWTPTFSSYDKIPYGSYVLFHSLEDIFGKGQVKIISETPYETLQKDELENTSLIYVQQDFEPTLEDVEQFLEFVDKGNNLFIASKNISGIFSDTLRLREKTEVNLYPIMKILGTDTVGGFKSNFTHPLLKTDSGYWHKRTPISYYFDLQDSVFISQPDSVSYGISDAWVLGTNGNNNPVFLRLSYGNGFIFLHNNPFAFTNYYLLEPTTAEYVAKCLSYIPKGTTVLWDEYYKHGKEGSMHTPLNFILTHAALKWAYYTAVVFLLLYVLFNIKRRQRIIPVVHPYANTSLQFTQTVGALYFNQSDHKDIALKKNNYLLEFIRTRYNLDTSEINDEFARRLSNKSGVELERIQYLLSLMNGIQAKNWVSDTELIELNNTIEYFKKNSQQIK